MSITEQFKADLMAQHEAQQKEEWAKYPEWIRRFNEAHQENFNRAMMSQMKKLEKEWDAWEATPEGKAAMDALVDGIERIDLIRETGTPWL